MVRLPPVITYVTDPDLSLSQQQRVIEQIVAAGARGHLVRVAFRLPDLPVAEVESILNWYESTLPSAVSEHIIGFGALPAVVQYRPDFSSLDEDRDYWFPFRCRSEIAKSASGGWCSVHSVEEARAARDAGATGLVIGNIFPTESHPGRTGFGVRAFREIAGAAPSLNAIAIGGINLGNVREIGRARITSYAVMRALSRSENIEQTLEDLAEEWRAGSSKPMESNHE